MKKNNKEKLFLIALDRDGTLIYDDGYFGRDENWKEKIKFYDGAIEAVKLLNSFSRVIVTSNQIGVARGFYGPKRVEEINRFLNSVLRKRGAEIAGWYFSPYVERDWAKENNLDLNTPWILDDFPETRKPKIGMLKIAASDFGKELSFYKKIFVIGDSLDDLNMALNVGGIGVFFENEKNSRLIEDVKFLELSNPGKIFRNNNLISIAKKIKKLALSYYGR